MWLLIFKTSTSLTFFGIVETWLDEFSCKHIIFQNYILVHRRGRPGALPGRVNHGGSILYRCHIDAPLLTFLEESPVAERLWARVETDLGPLLLGLWYRPPNAEDEHFTSLESEIERLSADYVGSLLIGDFNVHQRRWLRYSLSNTVLGKRLQSFCSKHGVTQSVKEPTHVEGNLLDLVLTSLPCSLSCSTTPRIADHNGVLTEINVPICIESEVSREVWVYKKADWVKLEAMLSSCDWRFCNQLPVDDAAEALTNRQIAEIAFLPKFVPSVASRIHG